MVEYIKPWFDLLSELATILATLFIILAYRAYKISKKQLNLGTITRCIDYYRVHFVEIDTLTTNLKKMKSYLDFVNEELFYFENGYIINTVIYEWLDSMIDVLPIFNGKSVLNENNCNKIIIEQNLLKPNPRIKKAFTIVSEYNFDIIYSEQIINEKERKEMREKLFKEILKNLKK